MLKLSDNEKQEIVRFLEADKPLPEKYRFLLFEDKREVELVWNGKHNRVSNLVLPFQTIEQVDEPRAEKHTDTAPQLDLFSTDARGRQLQGWSNKLIWGDNKLILSSLLHGPMRQEIEKQGGLKLIYIDPPFDVGADFSMNIEIGEDSFTKKPNILEEIAYRDTWGKGTDSFIAMIYERLLLMRDLLADDGSIYVHCDYRLNSCLRLVLGEIFGCYKNEIIWQRTTNTGSSKGLANKLSNDTDSILYFGKTNNPIFNKQYKPYSDDYLSRFKYEDGKGKFRWQYMATYSQEKYQELESRGEIRWNPGSKNPEYKQYLDSLSGISLSNLWTDIFHVNPMALEGVNYPTQKPEALLERILKASSNEGDLVADFFCGSGTTAAVAEKLGRKWICTDLGKFAIHTTRKRLIGVQRQMKQEGKDYRSFEVLNLGKYERQHFVGVNLNLREEEQQKQLQAREAAFLDLILGAYRAERVEGFACFQGKRSGRLVSVGPVNLPVTRLFVEEIILECRRHHITKVDILGFEFEMGLFPNVLEEARGKGIDLAPKYIPADVFDKRAVEKRQVVFHDAAYVEVKPHLTPAKKGVPATLAVELTDFSVFYSQDSVIQAEEELAKKSGGGIKIIVEHGQIVKLTMDKKGLMNREQLTQRWVDWIDYWAVDFDFENKREIVRIKNPATGEMEERWTGDYVFENEWQSFRTKKDRSLELITTPHEVPAGRRKVAVKVVDIFGNDTMTILSVDVKGGR